MAQHTNTYTSPYALYGYTSVIFIIILSWIFSQFWGFTLLSCFLALNAVSFLLFGFDKSIAGSGATRVPEVIFYGLSFAGGTPGAFIGQRIFRHKIRKTSFQVIFWLIVGLQAFSFMIYS